MGARPLAHATEGLVAAIGLRRDRPGFPVLVLSQWVEQLSARELMASGDDAVGYPLEDRVADVRSFVAAVHQVADGGTVLDPQVVSAVLAAVLVVTEKAVGTRIDDIFSELGLPVDGEDDRRVLAVLRWLQSRD